MAAYPGQQDPDQQGYALLWWLAPIGLVLALLLVGYIAVSALGGAGGSSEVSSASAARRALPVYWVVKAGDSYSRIVERTGLTMEQLEAFNPRTDPTTIIAGQRIKLRLHVPKAARKPLGPRFWTVRKGQSFGSIAARTGRSIDRLRRLNPKLKPEALRIGDRVRLRR